MELVVMIVLVVSYLAVVGYYAAMWKATNTVIPIRSQKTTKSEYLRRCYNLITTRFQSTPWGFLTRPWRNIFLGNIWEKGNVLPCHVQSLLLRRLLCYRFAEGEIKSCWVVMWHPFVIHNYLKVKLNNQWMSIDPWGKRNGVPFGRDMLSAGYAKR